MRRHSRSIVVTTVAILLACGAALAADIECGQTIERTIERSGQSDTLAYDGGIGDVLSITVVPVAPDTDCVARGLTFDPYWEIFDPDGRRVQIPLGDGGRRCLGLGGAAACETAPLDESSENGPYTLVVTDFGKNCGGTYRITVENVSGTVDGIAVDPANPQCARFNDKGKPDGTQPITRGEPVSGAIDDVGETDTFTFAGQQGETVTIQLTPGTSNGGMFDPRWTLFGPDGSAVSDDCSTLTCARGPLTAGTYTIKVFDSDENATGDYTLLLQPQDQPTSPTTSTTTTSTPSLTTTTTLLQIVSGQSLYDLTSTLRRTTSSVAPAERLGTSLATDGQHTLVIGSPFDQTLGQAAGAAFVVSLDAGSYGKLLPQDGALFNPDGGNADDHFGAAVALVGTSVVVGAPGASPPSASVANAGAVYLFPRVPGSPLTQPRPVTGSDFGATLAASNNDLYVGAPSEGAGKVYWFEGTALKNVYPDATFPSTAVLTPGDRFGFAIAVTPDLIAIGAPGLQDTSTNTPAFRDRITGSPATCSRPGRVFLFEIASGAWHVIESPSASNDCFGAALTFVDSTLFIGAPGGQTVFKLLDPDRPPVPFLTSNLEGLDSAGGLGAALAPAPSGLLVGVSSGSLRGSRTPGGVVVRLGLDGQAISYFAKDRPEDDDQYGAAIAASGSNVFIGAPLDDAGNVDGGAVYAYQPNLIAIFRKRLTDASFGMSIGANADTIAVGSPTDANGRGAVYTFDPHDATCTSDVICKTLGDPVTGNDGSRLGQSVAVVGPTGRLPIVGAPFEKNAAGAAYLMQPPSKVTPQIRNPPEVSAGDQFGFAVAAVEGDLLVAAPLLGSTDTGAVFVFDQLQNLRVVLRKPVPATGDFFGAAIAGEGDTAAVGAPFDSTAAPKAGAVYLFNRSTAELLTGQPLVSPTASERELFGAALAMSADLIAVGAPSEDGLQQSGGRVYLFRRPSPDAAPTFLSAVDNPRCRNDPSGCLGDRFGAAVAIVDNQVLVGAPRSDDSTQDTGVAYLVDPGTLSVQTFRNPAQGAFDRFGSSVTAGPSGPAIGAPGPVRVYVYTKKAAAASPSLAVTNAFGSTAAAAGPRCGDGNVDPGEQCDDGNDIDTDDCRNNCTERCCVIDPAAAERCNDFDPCTDDSVDATGACVNVDNGTCCSSDASCAGDSACRLCAGCSLFPWDCCDQGSTCILDSPQCADKTCFDEAACECAGGLTCSDSGPGSTPTQQMTTDFGVACEDIRLEQDGASTNKPMATARTRSKDARKMLKSVLHDTRSAYKSHDISKKCRAEFIEDIRRVRKSVPTGQRLRKCVTESGRAS